PPTRSVPDGVNAQSDPLRQSGSNPRIPFPPPSWPQAPPSAPSAPNSQPMGLPPAPHEAGVPGQGSGTWGQMGMGMPRQPGTARVIGIGLAIGGTLFFAGIVVLVIVLRGGAPATTEPAHAPVAEQAAP